MYSNLIFQAHETTQQHRLPSVLRLALGEADCRGRGPPLSFTGYCTRLFKYFNSSKPDTCRALSWKTWSDVLSNLGDTDLFQWSSNLKLHLCFIFWTNNEILPLWTVHISLHLLCMFVLFFTFYIHLFHLYMAAIRPHLQQLKCSWILLKGLKLKVQLARDQTSEMTAHRLKKQVWPSGTWNVSPDRVLLEGQIPSSFVDEALNNSRKYNPLHFHCSHLEDTQPEEHSLKRPLTGHVHQMHWLGEF